MNSFSSLISNNLLSITNKANEILNTKLEWKNTHFTGKALVSLVASITKEQSDLLWDSKFFNWCNKTFENNNYYIDVHISEQYETYLVIDVSINEDAIISSVCSLFPKKCNPYSTKDVSILVSNVVYKLTKVTSKIQSIVNRLLQWNHYYDHGDEVVGLSSLNFNEEEMKSIYKFYKDKGEETIVFHGPQFDIGLWEQKREDNFFNICLNVKMEEDNDSIQTLIRNEVIKLFPIEHIDPSNAEDDE